MRKLLRQFQFLCNNKVSMLLILALISSLSFLVHYQISAYDIYYQKIELANEMQLSSAVIMQYPFEFYIDKSKDFAQMAQEYDTILRENDKIEDFQSLSSFEYYAISKDKKVTLELDYLSDIVLKGTQYRLVSGTWPDAPNEVALNEDVKGYFDIGDKILIQVIQNSDDLGDPSAKWLDVQLIVSGFIDRNAVVLDFSGASTSPTLDTYMKSFYESYTVDGPCVVEDYASAMGVIYDAQGSDGGKLERNLMGKSFLIRPANSASVDELKNELMLLNIGEVYSGDELIRSYIDANKAESKTLMRGITILILLSASSLFSAVFLQLKKRKTEMALLCMTGMTPFLSSTIFGLYYLLVVAFGNGLGYGIFYALYNEVVAVRNEQFLTVMMIFLCFSVILIAPFYILARKLSPIDYLRKD